MPRPRISTDLQTWLAYQDTADKVQDAADICRDWLVYYQTHQEMDVAYRSEQHRQWSERLKMLRTKALIMGVTLEE